MSTSSESTTNNLKAGLFTIAALVLGFLTILVLNSSALKYLFGNYNEYLVHFNLQDGVSGLSKGSEVRVGGLVQGRVTDIKLVNLKLAAPAEGEQSGTPDKGDDDDGPGALVRIEMNSDIQLWSNAVAIRTVPILGGSSWINITTIGGTDQYTVSRSPRNGKEAVKLPVDGKGMIPATPGDGLLTTIVGPENAVTTRQLLNNVEGFTAFLDSDVVKTFDRDVRPALADARTVVGDLRTDYGSWRKELDLTFDSVASAADRLDQTMGTAQETMIDARTDVRMIGQLINRNVGRLDAAIANVQIMTEDGVAITHRLKDSTLARVDEAIDAGATAIDDLADILNTLDLEITASLPSVRAFLQDALIAAGELKLATIEIRRSPWRILYQPKPGEIANENLFAAARDFTIAASEVRSAAESLQAVLESSPNLLDAEPDLEASVKQFLSNSLRRLESAQSRLFSVIIGDVADAPQPNEGEETPSK